MNKQGRTAAEVAAELAKDKAYQAKLRAQEEWAAKVREEEARVMQFLTERGVGATSIDELVSTRAPLDKKIVDGLLAALATTSSVNVLEAIVRALGAAADPFDAAPLARLFEQTESEQLRWAIANTLALVRPAELRDWIVKAVRERRYGKAREMLALAVARTSPRRLANEVLVDLLGEMPGHAALGLAEIGGPEELEALQRAHSAAHGWEKEQIGRTISIITRRREERA